jgi:type II secretory ATPase GspE/PulE/Tfp pilus assembly ATPase PilB-like protein
VIFKRKAEAEADDEEEEIEQVLFQGAVNGKEADLKGNAKLVQAGLVRAKELVSEGMSRRAEMIRLDTKGQAAVAALFVDGVPYPAGKMPAQAALAITQMLKLLAGLDIKVRDKPQSGGINAEYSEKKWIVKVDAQPVPGGPERLIVRIEDPKVKLEKPEEIGLTKSIREKVREISSQRVGVILAAGPPMSGVSVTGMGLLRSVDAYLYNIYNLADLGGRDLSHITTFKRNEGETLVQWLTRAKRQECDVMFVDPFRDAEFVKTILDEAEDRSFLSEMTAKDTADAVVRLNAWTGDPKLTAERVKLIVSTKLIRKLCPECKQAYRPNPKLLSKVGLPPETKVLYRVPRPTENEKGEVEEPPDCPKCGNLGYFGRMALFEVLEVTPDMKTLIASGADAAALKAQARKEGMQAFQKDGLTAVGEGKTSLEELQRVFQQKAP